MQFFYMYSQSNRARRVRGAPTFKKNNYSVNVLRTIRTTARWFPVAKETTTSEMCRHLARAVFHFFSSRSRSCRDSLSEFA